MKKIEIGAPLMRDANSPGITEQLGGVEFPLAVTVENRMPRDVSLPEMGLFLRHVCNNEGLNVQDVRVESLSQIQRTVTSIEKIAEINNYQTAIIISFLDPVLPVVAGITLDAVDENEIIEAAKASTHIAITGSVGGDVKVGDTVTLTVNGVEYAGLVQTGNVFSINVAGAGLVADGDKAISASVTAVNSAGDSITATDIGTYTVASGASDDLNSENKASKPKSAAKKKG